MIRISRIIAKDRVANLLDLDYVAGISIRHREQGFRNPAICRVDIYLQVPTDSIYFRGITHEIIKWGRDNKCNRAVSTCITAKREGFIKESAFDDFPYPMPREYKKLCKLYSQQYFDVFNKEGR